MALFITSTVAVMVRQNVGVGTQRNQARFQEEKRPLSDPDVELNQNKC